MRWRGNRVEIIREKERKVDKERDRKERMREEKKSTAEALLSLDLRRIWSRGRVQRVRAVEGTHGCW